MPSTVDGVKGLRALEHLWPANPLLEEVVMKFFAIPCVIMAGLFAGSAVAGQPGNDIEVSAPTSVAAWRDNLARNLDYNLDSEIRQSTMTGSVPTGMASVRFTSGKNGKPEGIEFTRKAGNRRLNSMAKDVVEGITLHPLPAGMDGSQVFIANIVVASDDRALDRDLAILRDEAQRQNRMAAGANRPIAFNVSANAR
jgi:hypothetical protein